MLVEWHIDSGQRRFVPRLGAEIKAISVSPDDTIYAVSLANNTVKLVASMNLDLKQAIQGLHGTETCCQWDRLNDMYLVCLRSHY